MHGIATIFKTQAEARMAVFDFIQSWYNPHRRHSALDYLSPIDYEPRVRCRTHLTNIRPGREPTMKS
jgi:transposase InsO family protein